MSVLVQMNDVEKSYGTQDVLDGVHWRLLSGSRVALVGRNGAGKTTLFRLLTGEEEADRGTVQLRNGATVAAMDQELPLDAGQTLREEAARGLAHLHELEAEFEKVTQELAQAKEGEDHQDLLDRYTYLEERLHREDVYAAGSRVDAVLEGLHFGEEDLDRPLREFSGGQKSRASLARVLLRDPDLLLLDEPTNHLDLDAIEWLESFLASWRGAYVLVSHDRVFLNRLSREVAELRGGRLHAYTGNYDDFLVERERRLEDHHRRYELQQEEIRKTETFIRKNIARASTSNRAKSRRNQLERMERIEAPEVPASSLRMRLPEPERAARNVFELKRVAKRYGESIIFRDVSFLVTRGRKVGLVGPNGVGKSTLIRLLVGEESPTEGVVRVGPGVSIGYFEQEQRALRGDTSVLDELWSVTPSATETEMRTFLGSFLFREDAVHKALHMLSGGERSRLALAKLVRRGTNVLVLDEPTNHLDLESRAVMEQALEAFQGTIVVASHDRALLRMLCDEVVALRADGCDVFDTGYEGFAEARAAARTPSPPSAPEPKAKPLRTGDAESPAGEGKRSYEENKQRRREEARLRKRTSEAEERVMDLETRKEGLTLALADPEVLADPARVADLGRSLQAVEGEIREAMSEWERLAARLEAFLDGDNA